MLRAIFLQEQIQQAPYVHFVDDQQISIDAHAYS